MKKIKWTDEVIKFMIDNYQGKDNIELANLLNEKFNLNTNGDRVSNEKAKIRKKYGINMRTGINRGCYPKGNIPMNKGKKWNDYMSVESQSRSRQTTFKKNNIPVNHREVGEERINVDGYYEIKTKEPNVWQLKHRYIYEQHYGSIPKDYVVIFLDGNTRNFDISNLKAISRQEHLIMNEYKLRFSDKTLTDTSCLIAKIESKRRNLKNERF